MPCMCGATDCPSCGPAQGYTVLRRRDSRGGYEYYNPEEEEVPVLQAGGRNARLRLLLTDCARYIAGGAAQWGKKELLERIEEELK